MPTYFKSIKLLHWLVKLGSLQKAADQVGISRQAASQSLINMEAEYGVKIVSRTSNKLYLTSQGIELSKLCGDFVQKTARIQKKNVSEVIIVSNNFIVDHILPSAAQAMRDITGAKFTFLGDNSGGEDCINIGDIYIGPDFLIRDNVKKVPIPLKNLYEFYAHPSYLKNRRYPNAKIDLYTCDHVVYKDIAAGVVGLNYSDLDGKDVTYNQDSLSTFSVNSIDGIISLANKGLGVVALTREQASLAPDLVKVSQVRAGDKSQLFIHYGTNSPKAKLVHSCVQYLEKYFSDNFH